MTCQPRYHLILLVVTLLSLVSVSQKCQFPQKGLFLSYNALSKRDTIANMFTEINGKIEKFNDAYSENSTNYNIKNMHPQMYYSEHDQIEKYVDSKTVQVTLGDIQFAFRMDYVIQLSDGTSNTGFARGRVLMDQEKKFKKSLISNDGILEWNPKEIQDLTATHQLVIDHSQPALSDSEKRVYQLIVNDHIKDGKLKQNILASFNQHYKDILKEHLNSEHLASDVLITYKYNNITVDFLNAYRQFSLKNTQDKGLEVLYTFEIDNDTLKCDETNITFHEEQGGVQEVISNAQIYNAILVALEQGLADVTVDKSWQVPQFQLYMGDLGNAFPAAYMFPPEDPFSVNCQWDKNVSNIEFRNHDVHQLYVNFGIICKAIHKQSQLFKFQVDTNFVVRLVAEEQELVVLITAANSFNPKITAIDSNFQTYNLSLVKYSLSQVLIGMINHRTFGTGWIIYKRKFPAVHIKNDAVVLYDPSEK